MSLNNPSQDLIFFKDNSLISKKILNNEINTKSKNSNSYLSVITYNQSTSPNWLINGLIEDTLFGNASKSLNNHELSNVSNESISNTNRRIMVISFLHNKEFYIKNCKRIGINLEDKQEKEGKFQFIDYFNDLFINLIKNPNDALKDINKMFDDIINNSSLDKNDDDNGSDVDVIILEGVEILLFATNIASNELLFNINRLNKKCRQLFVVSSKDCLKKHEELVTPSADPMVKINEFLIKLLHRSQLNITLEPLITGRAKDITGSLIISKGCIPYDDNDENLSVSINEKEYVYHITKDSQVKLFYR
ncbi:subunit of Elongator complex, putative [Candida dubliniensis CD36]|uniref:Subunit of Elongator complex, putative n=1 Tax=Candida dubliniensis (strain CD36 / ATCC MYA-646 / CBS 7987 / NCPF 3949 / NRRL Y-17841) TaxID=573826 RepID=B9WFG2_CANDC|nr:subunit of Elongator complex, putative [Candida dubliniensis CD36]CAX41981.1 subunit of Elongator complex, putative [Candida dubliniensis CD36]